MSANDLGKPAKEAHCVMVRHSPLSGLHDFPSWAILILSGYSVIRFAGERLDTVPPKAKACSLINWGKPAKEASAIGDVGI